MAMDFTTFILALCERQCCAMEEARIDSSMCFEGLVSQQLSPCGSQFTFDYHQHVFLVLDDFPVMCFCFRPFYTEDTNCN